LHATGQLLRPDGILWRRWHPQYGTSSIQGVVVDETRPIRKALTRLLRSVWPQRRELRLGERVSGSARASDAAACLVLDVQMPELTGLDLQPSCRMETRRCHHLPDGPRRHSDDRGGAEGRRFGLPLEPVQGDELLGAVERALVAGRASAPVERSGEGLLGSCRR